MSNITFVNDKLTFLETQSEKSVKRLEVFLRPTEKNEFFRFRLLWFKNKNNSRKTPWIERHIHSIWETGANGKPSLAEVVCPTSKYVAEKWDGNAYDSCPICKFAGLNYAAYKDSNKKDKIAQQNLKNFKYKYDLVIPVYVVSDPVYSANGGKVRVFRINDKAVGEKFKQLVLAKSSAAGDIRIFNSVNALDFLIRMDKVRHVVNEGTEAQYEFTKNEIVQMGFSNKAYDIPALTPDMIEDFPFDDVFGAVPTVESLKEFHKKYCLHANTDDIDFNELEDTTNKTISSKQQTNTENKNDLNSVNDLTMDNSPTFDDSNDIDSFDINNEVQTTSSSREESDTGDVDVDAILADVGLPF